MGAILGLTAGIGLLLIWQSCWPQPARTSPAPRARWRSRLEDLIAAAGVEGLTPAALIAISAAAGIVTGALVLGVSTAPPLGALAGVFAAFVPISVFRWRARQRHAELVELWPDAVDNLASGIRAGLSLPEALTQLGVRGPEALRRPFVRFGEDYRSSGQFGPCLDLLGDRLADPVGDRVVESLRVAREVGGSDLGSLLRTLSGFLRDDARTRAELQTRQGWTVNAARLAVAAPWVLLALMSTRSASVQAYDRPAGWIVLGVGAVVCVLAYRLMIRLGRLPQELRVLR